MGAGRSATATHYEVLGVAPDASHDVVKRAYLDHALRFHPDRQPDLSADARERNEFRMREINDAWAVLRNPASRAHYDDELRHATADDDLSSSSAPGPSSAAAAARARAAGATATEVRPRDVVQEPEVADLARDDSRPTTTRRRPSRWRTWLPVLIGAVVLTTVIIVAAAAQSDDGPELRVNTVEQFGVGTCVVIEFGPALANDEQGGQARGEVVPVPCTEPGSRRIVDRVPFPKPCPQGSSAELLAESRESLCLV